MEILVGYTGFVGSNINKQYNFDYVFNSKNIIEAFGMNPDLCVYAGIRAEMFLANTNPAADMEAIKEAIENIKKINPKRLVLISTIAVYNNPINVYEDAEINEKELTAYGRNRLYLEEWVKSNLNDYFIIRLPAIYGCNLKKNFIYDMIHISPPMLSKEKYEELCMKDDYIKDYYSIQENGFYKCLDSKSVKFYFEKIGFSSLNFTDSRSVFQFYNLKYLWNHIRVAIENNYRIFNIATEPISAAEIYKAVFKQEFVNILNKPAFNYDMKTQFFKGGYLFTKEEVLLDIINFTQGEL